MTDSYRDLNDFYQDVVLFTRRLREAGLEQLSQSLEVAMAGSTSGETLTDIAHLLTFARKEGRTALRATTIERSAGSDLRGRLAYTLSLEERAQPGVMPERLRSTVELLAPGARS